ncbi:hypothetical protein [Nocardioides zhouii]|uniref:Uncharacterized protein n=1 Tax=Nocardioides zhouii TaxID=1168729 RepID=A0A4Q2SNF7_9ACTN|nr:hypothetical protein [Nocardioides zhouii]RYC07225.1 hypothetical protein EUA94_15150 [Nocardioides zhouii]
MWRDRLLIGATICAAGYPLAVWLKLGPEPVPYVVMSSVVLMLVWLVFDTVESEPAQWTPALPSASDRVDEATSDLRILTSHQQASVPSEAVRDRLVALARARDPDLAATVRHELTPVRRLSPAEIDRILTRIEEVRDRS